MPTGTFAIGPTVCAFEGIELLIAASCRDEHPSPARPQARRTHKQSNQVRRWREVFNEGAKTPDEKIRGLWRIIGVAQAARNLAAAGRFCIGILRVSRMFHPASIGVSAAMQPLPSLSKC